MDSAARSQRSFSIDSFYELLRARVSLDSTDYGTWLLQCIKDAELPVSHVFGPAIREFVSSVFTEQRVRKIPEEALYAYFQDISTITPVQVLLLLYILMYNEAVIAYKSDPKLMALDHGEQHEYSPAFVRRIPLRSVLNHVEQYKNGQAYRGIYPEFIAMTANLYPELFDVTSLLLQEGKDDYGLTEHPKTVSVEELQNSLSRRKEDPATLVSVLRRLAATASIELTNLIELVVYTLFPACLDEKDLDPTVVESLIAAWESFDQIIPHELWMMTANAIKDPVIPKEYTMENTVEDVLSLFSCDQRIFRSKRLLRTWLHVLSCMRICAKHRIWKHFYLHYTVPDPAINARNVVALINHQDSGMIQLLLSACIPTDTDKDDPDTLRAVQEIICQFIHTIFIDGDRDMLLVKILHFQTYATELIPLVVDLIPSIYVVINFIPELLRQPRPEQQVFGILMACHLCEKYPLESFLMVAQNHVLPRLRKLAFPTGSQNPSAPPVLIPSDYLIQAIPGFVHMARGFPHFSANILQVLEEIANNVPAPQKFIGQESSSKIILILRLHQVLNDTMEQVREELRNMDKVDKTVV
ncbi:hypothetical protein VTP01DRAFT_9296 [Rhizomucor pusillus]|uniref:uncharacterized protein n=1 Tax=Rhizomucor pusillus TaxID=4840 RepID=UPI00374321F2